MKNTIKKAYILRLILALVFFTAIPAQAHAALIDTDSISSWLRAKLAPMVWAEKLQDKTGDELVTIQGIALMSARQPLIGVTRVYETFVTAYSSSVDETDSTPFITASGEYVRDGIVAANFLPLGTQIKIPEYFGDKIFVVKDRMARRHTEKVDVWFESKELAKEFGKRKLQVQVVDESI